MNMKKFKKTFEKLKDNPMFQSYCSVLEEKDKVIKRLVKENQKLETNWNELRKWLEDEEKEYRKTYYPSEYGWMIGTISRTLTKMEEIEGDKNE